MNIVIQRTAKQYLQLASRHRQFCVHMKINSGFAGPVPAANQMASSTAYHFQSVGVSQESVLNPGQTIQFELPVIDTHPGDNERPVVLGVHGAPGLAADFEPLIRMLSERNVRFIAPTFPGFETTQVESWKLYHLDYSTEGLASIVEQIVENMAIDKVSVLMGHSAGSWVGYKLAAENSKVQSLCLLNPCGSRPHRTLRPHFVIRFIAWLLRHQNIHFLLLPLAEKVYSQIGFTGVKAGEHLVVSQQVVSQADFQQIQQHAEKIREKEIPLLFAYALNDKIIEAQISEEMLFQHLNVDKDSVTKVDSAKNKSPLCGTSVDPAKGTDTVHFAQGLQFERGGHVVHKAHSEIILDRVLQLLAHVDRQYH